MTRGRDGGEGRVWSSGTATKRRPRIRAVLGVLVVALVAGIGGSHFYRHWVAGDLAKSIRSMPGVSATDVSYSASIDGSHYFLGVDLADDATPAQAAAVGRYFVDRMWFNAFDGFDVRLTVSYKATLDVGALYRGSRAEFDYYSDVLARGGPSSDEVATSDRDSARAGTDTIDLHPALDPTDVEIEVDSGPDQPQRIDKIAHAVTPLLPGLGLPVRLRLNDIKFTLGGCEGPDHTPSALESELRRQYEHC